MQIPGSARKRSKSKSSRPRNVTPKWVSGLKYDIWYSLHKSTQMVLRHGSFLEKYWDLTQVVFSILACIQYVIETYPNNTCCGNKETCKAIEYFFTGMFTIDYIGRLLLADTKLVRTNFSNKRDDGLPLVEWGYIVSFYAMVDVLTVVPVYIEIGLEAALPESEQPPKPSCTPAASTYLTSTQSQWLSSLSFLRFARILRIVRILQTFKALNTTVTKVQREITKLSLFISSLLFITAGLVHLCEEEPFFWFQMGYTREQIGLGPLYFMDAVYFTIVTFATVGYGEFVPNTMLGKVVVCFAILFFLVMTPVQINKVQATILAQSQYRVTYKKRHYPHVLIFGDIDHRMLDFFLTEFYHEDRDSLVGREVVILNPKEPSEEMRALLQISDWESKVHYVKGSPMVKEDLRRVKADIADACFIFCSKCPKDAKQEDIANTMRSIMVEHYANNNGRDIITYVQLHSPTPAHGNQLLKYCADFIVPIEEWKARALCMCALCPGFTTIFDNIFSCYASDFVDDFTNNENNMNAFEEYRHGLEFEFYQTEVPTEALEQGVLFWEFVYRTFNFIEGQHATIQATNDITGKTVTGYRHGIVYPVGLIRGAKTSSENPYLSRDILYDLRDAEVMLNPWDVRLQEGDRVLLICSDQEHVDMFEKLGIWKKVGAADELVDGQETTSCCGLFGSSVVENVEDEAEKSHKNIRRRSSVSKDDIGVVIRSQGPGKLKASKEKIEFIFYEELPVKNLSDHIVVTGYIDTIDCIRYCLETFRSSTFQHTELEKPLVFLLASTKLDSGDELSNFYKRLKIPYRRNVYFLKGEPRNKGDLLKAKVDRAFSVVIFGDSKHIRSIDGDQLDTTAILSYVNVDEVLRRKYVKQGHRTSKSPAFSSKTSVDSIAEPGFTQKQHNAHCVVGLSSESSMTVLNVAHSRCWVEDQAIQTRDGDNSGSILMQSIGTPSKAFTARSFFDTMLGEENVKNLENYEIADASRDWFHVSFAASFLVSATVSD
eukprot:g2570.t1